MTVASRLFSFVVVGSPASFVSGHSRGAVSPVEKVIDLLKQLQADIEKQGTKEAVQYEKFACFCKNQADDKLYQIEKSKKKIDKLDAQIDELDTQIKELNADITTKQDEIDTLTANIKEAADQRSKENEDYKKKDADVSGAIDSMKAAIKALKESKSDMKDAKLDLAQVHHAVNRAVKTVEQMRKVAVFFQLVQDPASYEYRSNDIIQTLEDLLDVFLKNKKDDDEAEFEARAAWEKKDLNLKNTRKFTEQDKAEAETIASRKSSEKAAATEDRDEETNDKNADGDFMKVLTKECEDKATAWDQRRETRADEVKAIQDAMESLTEKVSKSWGANKKLAGIQIEAVPARPVSFLQVQRGASLRAAAVERAKALLVEAAKGIGSPALAQMMAQFDSSADHFVKVRGLIKDLVARLEADAAAEADHKSFCDKALAKNKAKRDGATDEIESLKAEKTRDEAERDKLTQEVADLSEDIAGLNKALNEATELRSKEKQENEETVATAKEGKAGTELALKLLQDFYASAGGASLVQAKYVPPNSDREGKTFADRAPEVFDNDGYRGKQTESKGIVGLLEVILSDFERTIKTTDENEAAAQEEFDAFETSTKESVDKKDKSKETKEDRISELKDEITDGEDSLKEQRALLKNAEETLEDLKSQCTAAEETYAERVAKREKEIASLKEALNIFENWQGL